MAGMPENFKAISNVLASYNFVDIAAGTGFINFYAGNTVDLKLLSNFTYYSDLVALTSSGVSTDAYAKVLDLDFDVVLNRPLDVMGKVVVNLPMGLLGTGRTIYAYFIVTLRKWNGAETDIVTNTSSVSNTTVTPSTLYFMKSIDLDIPLTHFKIGETLRLTVEGWAKLSSVGTTEYLYLGNDPKNRSTGWDTTGAVPSQLVFQCPVRLSL